MKQKVCKIQKHGLAVILPNDMHPRPRGTTTPWGHCRQSAPHSDTIAAMAHSPCRDVPSWDAPAGIRRGGGGGGRRGTEGVAAGSRLAGGEGGGGRSWTNDGRPRASDAGRFWAPSDSPIACERTNHHLHQNKAGVPHPLFPLSSSFSCETKSAKNHLLCFEVNTRLSKKPPNDPSIQTVDK